MSLVVDLFLEFTLLAFVAFGGATALLPEMHRVVVDNHHWLDDTTFTHLYAIAQAAPGPNVLVVTLIGWKVAGLAGALAAPRGGSAAGTATGTATGAVSTTTGACAGAGWGSTGAATRGAEMSTGGLLGALGRSGLALLAAGTWASFLGDTGRKAVAAPLGLGAARAASARFSSSDSAWYASHWARLSSGARRLVAA